MVELHVNGDMDGQSKCHQVVEMHPQVYLLQHGHVHHAEVFSAPK